MIKTELFYGCTTFLYTVLRCRLRSIMGHHSRPALFLAGCFACAVGSVFEDVGQLQNTLLYQGKDVLHILGNMATSRNIIPKMDEAYSYTWTFAIGLAILNYYYTVDPVLCPYPVKFIFDKLFGKSGERDNVEKNILDWLLANGLIHPRRKSVHRWNILDIFVGMLKNFGFGYLAGLVIGIIGSPEWKLTSMVHSARTSGFNTGCYLASLIGLYRFSTMMLRSVNNKLSSPIVGFVSAWAMLLSRYKLGATLSLSYGISCVIKDLLQRGILPKLPYAASIMYGLIGGVCIYAVQFENPFVLDSVQELLSALVGSESQFFKKISPDMAKTYNLPLPH